MGIRTPVWALRGPRPGPLDDGGVFKRRDCIIPTRKRQSDTQQSLELQTLGRVYHGENGFVSFFTEESI